jgi:hypothetical protein
MDSLDPELPDDENRGPGRQPDRFGFGTVLLIWMALVVALNAVRWAGGFPSGMLAEGVEQGVARVEIQANGEAGDETIRKSIRTQRATLSFWSALAAIDDFLIEPLFLAARAVTVATLFTAAAALTGRTPQYDRALVECARAQGFWVLGLATRLGLMIVLRRGEADVETSLAIFLPAGTYPAALWMVLRQLDLFALLGWGSLAIAGWKRGDAPLFATASICAGSGVLELGIRVAVGTVLGAAMRLSLMVR